MEALKQREYYKIFAGSNQSGGYDKLHLGYESSTTELELKKDTSTFFHVPFFTTTQALLDGSLTSDGAIAGPIPAMADRIFKKLGGYGNSTPWGQPSTTSNNSLSSTTPFGFTDGTWLCSWLYSLTGEEPVWLDRYYNPGRIGYDEALQGVVTEGTYFKNDPVFIDVPSTMLLEPGVWYQYYHNGEKTAGEIVKTFAGDNNTRLRLGISTWSKETKDDSIYNNTTIISNFKDEWTDSVKQTDTVDTSVLNFNNTDFIDTRVLYNSSYNIQNEFTINTWIQNNDWGTAPATQILGNLNNGGYGIFFDNLKYYPYFIIPENFYGHLFYFNQEGFSYLDKNTQPTTVNNPALSGISNPVSVAVNSNGETLYIDAGVRKGLYKLNHLGEVIAITRDNNGNVVTITGTPYLLSVDGDDNCHVITTTGTYKFDRDLVYISFDDTTPYLPNMQVTFDQSGSLIRQTNCKDVKFDTLNNKWVIDLFGNITCNSVSLTGLPANATNIAIDPQDNIWVLHSSNKIAKVSPYTREIISTFEIGTQGTPDTKHISFIYTYDRAQDTKTWYALIYHNFEKTLYQVTLNGEIKLATPLPSKLNIKESPPSQQDKNKLTFTGKGDFTGYEWKRIFNRVLYNNNPQIHFKLSIRKPIQDSAPSIYTVSVPVNYFTKGSWHLITCTLKNRTMSVYIDTRLRDEKVIPLGFDINYARKNDLFIGCPCGKTSNFNKEINSTALIFNGYIDSIKIYDYAIRPEFLTMFVRERFIGQNLVWELPTAALQYVEVIERFFKHKLPGSKSPFLKIKLSGLQITNKNTRAIIESSIRQAIEQIKPAYSELISIEWID